MPEPSPPPNPLQPTTVEAVDLARSLVATAHYAALAVLDPATGWPLVSRVGLATDADGVPLILVSGLSPHTSALMSDPRCSLLVGEPGKGDPLAHPRATIRATAETVPEDDRSRVAARYLSHHPKARLYADLPDFRYLRLVPVEVALNGGFGKAFRFSGAALLPSH